MYCRMLPPSPFNDKGFNVDDRPRHHILRQNDGSSLLVKKPFRESSTENNNLGSRAKKIESLLDQLKKMKAPLPFTYSKLIAFQPPDELHYTYDEQVAVLNSEEILAHVETCVSKGNDPCILPLCEMTTRFFKTSKVSSSPMIRSKEKLKQIPTSVLVRLTKKQKKYLAQIHQSLPIQRALSQMENDKPPETFVHGDYRFNNILFRKKPDLPLLHIVDWEMAGRGPRVYDWGTLLVDYILVYLAHNVETKGKPSRIHWETIEQLMFLHLQELHRIYAKESKTLHQEYYQGLGVQLLL